jgi:3-phenylpropionate/trans-cinnamate dioxygenase ferredoxin reductase subunit
MVEKTGDKTGKLVIIGGGPAGLSAARAYRDAGGSGPVRIISADIDAPYERPQLSKEFLRGDAEDEDLPLEDAEFYRDHDITLTLDEPVTSLDTGARTITTASGETVSYTTCVLATGSEPALPPFDGADHPDVHLLRSAASARRLRQAAGEARSAIIVGSGFIGCEAAVSLARKGVQVTLFTPESLPQADRLGKDAGKRILHWLKAEGVSVLTETKVEGIEDGFRVHTDLVPTLDAGFVLLATGIEPRIDLAKGAGLDIADGRIKVDEHMRTSADGVLAAGDIALAHNTSAGRALQVEHWGEALTMGEIAGRTAAGEQASWDNAPGFWTVIGDKVLKYAAWGDGFDQTQVVNYADGGFTVLYGKEGTTVGVLTHNADEDYDHGTKLVERAAPLPK